VQPGGLIQVYYGIMYKILFADKSVLKITVTSLYESNPYVNRQSRSADDSYVVPHPQVLCLFVH